MKKEKIQDERVLFQKRKIGSDAFQILFFGLTLSVFIQEYIFKAPFSQYAVEAVLLIFIAIYVVIRNLMVGNDIFSSHKMGQKLVFINSIVCGLIVAVINSTYNYINFGERFTKNILNTVLIPSITFFSASITAFVMFEILYIVNKKKQMQMDAKLKDDDIIES